MCKELGGNTDGTTDQRNIPYLMISWSANKFGRKVVQGSAVHELVEYQSADAEQLFPFALLLFLGLYFPFFVIYILNC